MLTEELRDRYRHPLETLSFFGLRDDLVVVEILPGGGVGRLDLAACRYQLA